MYPLTKLGGRRFILTVGMAVLYTALLTTGFIDQDTYQFLQSITVGVYIGANTFQKVQELRSQ